MRHFIVIFTLFLSQCQSLPIPAGQIIKYRVSSKYFNRQNDTSSSTDNSLYQLLSQIHYGTKDSLTGEEPSTVVSEQVTTIANEIPLEQHEDVVTTVINDIANEYPEVIFFLFLITLKLNE